MSTPGSYLPDPEQLRAGISDRPPEYSAGTTLDGARGTSRRRYLRSPVEACRPIALQLLDPQGRPASPWKHADILDVSVGGFCLLITEDEAPLPLAQLMQLRLDVRPHPSFGADEIRAELRWFVRSGYVVSLGVGFEQPMGAPPELLPCRRAERRSLEPDQTLG
jgi:hypothetical protein